MRRLPRCRGPGARSARGSARRFEERFSVERMARDYVALYDEVLRRGAVDALVLARTADQPARDAA